MNEVIIDGVVYVPKEDKTEGLEYCIVRTVNAGVFAGYVEEKNGAELTIREARRLWKWVGAASLSELAVRGVSRPDDCKFPIAEPRKIVREWIEIIPTTKEAQKIIEEVKVWTAH